MSIFSANGSLLAPLLPWHPSAHPYSDISTAQACFGQIACLPCPIAKPFYGQWYFDAITRLGIIAIVAIVFLAGLLLVYTCLPKSATTCNVHTASIAICSIVFCTAFTFSLTESELAATGCYDDITFAVGSRVKRCAASGFLYVFGVIGQRMGFLLWALDTHLAVVYSKKLYERQWIPALVSLGVPLIFALSGIKYQQFIIGPSCQPALGKPQLWIIKVPYAVIDLLTALIQLGTFAGIAWRFSRMPLDGSQSTTSSASHMPIVRTAKLFWRPIVLTTLNLLGTLLFISAFYFAPSAYDDDGRLSKAYADLAPKWVKCIAENQDRPDVCSTIYHSVFKYDIYAGGYFFVIAFSILFVVIMLKPDEMWTLLVRQKRHRDLEMRVVSKPKKHSTPETDWSATVAVTDPVVYAPKT
ncbi:hypothetical protein PYCC9005_004002 [Savitreella phatthalungensis]